MNAEPRGGSIHSGSDASTATPQARPTGWLPAPAKREPQRRRCWPAPWRAARRPNLPGRRARRPRPPWRRLSATRPDVARHAAEGGIGLCAGGVPAGSARQQGRNSHWRKRPTLRVSAGHRHAEAHGVWDVWVPRHAAGNVSVRVVSSLVARSRRKFLDQRCVRCRGRRSEREAADKHRK